MRGRVDSEFACAADDRGRRRVHLQAAARATRAWNTVGNNGAVAGFSGSSLHPVPDAPAEAPPGAHAGPEGVHAQRRRRKGAAGAENTFAVGGKVGVGVNVNGAVEPIFEFGAQVQPVKAGKIRWVMKDAERQFQWAGAADADAEQIAPGLALNDLANRAGHVVEYSPGAGCEPRRQADCVEPLTARRDGGNAEVGA